MLRFNPFNDYLYAYVNTIEDPASISFMDTAQANQYSFHPLRGGIGQYLQCIVGGMALNQLVAMDTNGGILGIPS